MSRLDDVQARIDDLSLTPGPWERQRSSIYGSVTVLDANGSIIADVHRSEVAAFIAHALQDIPALLAVAQAAQGMVAYWDLDANPQWEDCEAALRAALAPLLAEEDQT